jgi:hypothetical protein
MALKRVLPTLDPVTYWGRYMHTLGRVLSAGELLNAAARQHRTDSVARADELYEIAERLIEIGEGLRLELEEKHHG